MARSGNDIPNEGSSKFTKEVLTPNGYPARLVGAVFLGVQNQRPYQGTAKPPVEELRLTYELSHEFMKDEEGADIPDKPRWQSETVAFKSLKLELAKFTKRYNVLDPTGEHNGIIKDCLGAACSVLITNNVGSGKHAGKIFENIGDVTSAPNVPGYVQPEAVNDVFYYDPFDAACTLEEFRAQPEFIQEIIMGANNFAQSELAELIGAEGGAPAPEGREAPAEDTPDEDSPY